MIGPRWRGEIWGRAGCAGTGMGATGRCPHLGSDQDHDDDDDDHDDAEDDDDDHDHDDDDYGSNWHNADWCNSELHFSKGKPQIGSKAG